MLTDFVRTLIGHKRSEPGEDILTGLIHAEDQGDRLDDDGLVAMVLLLVAAGYGSFEDPDRFDIDRHPNNHRAFGHSVHFCRGANLARLEARVALGILFERNPNWRLAVDRSKLGLEPMPFWTRYSMLPVHLG